MKAAGSDERMWNACVVLLAKANIRALQMGWAAGARGNWWATAEKVGGNRISATGTGPVMALAALTEAVAATFLTCDCGRPIALSTAAAEQLGDACRWQLYMGRFRADPNHRTGVTP